MDKNGLSNEHEGMDRRTFLGIVGIAGASLAGVAPGEEPAPRDVLVIKEVKTGEDEHPLLADDLQKLNWQVFDAFAYATGDIVIGTSPVDSQVKSVAGTDDCNKTFDVTIEKILTI